MCISFWCKAYSIRKHFFLSQFCGELFRHGRRFGFYSMSPAGVCCALLLWFLTDTKSSPVVQGKGSQEAGEGKVLMDAGAPALVTHLPCRSHSESHTLGKPLTNVP